MSRISSSHKASPYCSTQLISVALFALRATGGAGITAPFQLKRCPLNALPRIAHAHRTRNRTRSWDMPWLHPSPRDRAACRPTSTTLPCCDARRQGQVKRVQCGTSSVTWDRAPPLQSALLEPLRGTLVSLAGRQHTGSLEFPWRSVPAWVAKKGAQACRAACRPARSARRVQCNHL